MHRNTRTIARGMLAAGLAAALALTQTIGALAAHPPAHPEATPANHTTEAFHAEMRRLWEDHVTWTRLVIVSFAADLPDLDAAVERLLKNQDDIGDAIKPFYGDTAGEQLSTLLREHITVAAEVLAGAKSRDTSAFDEANGRWYANADQIADFLAGANPDNWPQDEMRAMMKDHLDLTLAEASARLSGDVQGDIAAYDEVHRQILHMSDMLADGIVAQFPDTFTAVLPDTSTIERTQDIPAPFAMIVGGLLLASATALWVLRRRLLAAPTR